ncbi:MAG: hypothetical protein ACETVR_03240 [Candidatus Bathyarchaeia archaeon]
MTSLTLPLKKFPGQIQKIPTLFGGRLLVTPLTLLITVPFTLCLYYYLSPNSLLSYNLLGLLPYLWGSITITYHMKRSCDTTEKLFKANLSEAQIIFERGKKVLKRTLSWSIVISILNILISAYPFILYGNLPPFIITITSIKSLEIALISIILGLSSVKRIIAYLSFVSSSEAAYLFITFWGSWIFDLIFLVVSLLSLLSCLHYLDRYDLRRFFQNIVGSN